jgi:hypothetical protein
MGARPWMLTLGPKGKGYTMDVPTGPSAVSARMVTNGYYLFPRYKVWVGDLPRCAQKAQIEILGPGFMDICTKQAGHAMVKQGPVTHFHSLPEAFASFKRIAETKTWGIMVMALLSTPQCAVQATGLEAQGICPTALSASLSIGAPTGPSFQCTTQRCSWTFI